MALAGFCLTALAACQSTDGGLSTQAVDGTLRPVSNPVWPNPAALTPAEAANAATADNQDDLSLGKRNFRAGNYGLSEQHFRRAVEASPGDVDGWVGLAAAYDKLKRFDLADRAYGKAIAIAGPAPAILNNRGFSYLLRGDLVRARRDLTEAQAKDPENPHIAANLARLGEQPRNRAGR